MPARSWVNADKAPVQPATDEQPNTAVDWEALPIDFGPPRLRRADRVLAAGAYLGLLPFFIIASRPGPTFIRRHQYRAALIHLVRMLWTALIAGVWWAISGDGSARERLGGFGADFAMVTIVGIPTPDSLTSSAFPWLLTPLLVTWALSLIGFALAASGLSADFHAFASADWSDPVPRRRFLYTSPDKERELARRARDRQLERLQKSSQLMRSERSRRDQIEELQSQIERLRAQRDYYDQLLSLGEISQKRYQIANEELDEQVAEIRARLSELTTRLTGAHSAMPDRLRVNRLSRPAETLVESIAIVTPSGIPMYSYGTFQLDEAVVTGMLSAFDSLSEEVFGSRVHKTALSEGKVLFFAHGEHVLIMATFDDEPAPRQIEQLRTMLRQFEQANQGPLARGMYDTTYLHEVPIPFRFTERLAPANNAN